MGKFNFIKTKIKDLYIIEPKVFGDNRGYFMESYNKKISLKLGLLWNLFKIMNQNLKKGF